MRAPFHVVIPARYKSTRFPGKLLKNLKGMSIIERVYRQAQRANPASITIAVDSPELYDHAVSFATQVVRTKECHQSGTDRIAEAVELMEFSPDSIIVNVQGDEPLISPLLIQQVATLLEQNIDIPMATLCWPIQSAHDALNQNIVKVVRDQQDNALYFSRSVIPANRDNVHDVQNVYRHIGLYAYRASFLKEFVTWPVCELESQEALEQLRVLWRGYSIKVGTACVEPCQDINTVEDLAKAEEFLAE